MAHKIAQQDQIGKEKTESEWYKSDVLAHGCFQANPARFFP
jgi:hypothetical protein